MFEGLASATPASGIPGLALGEVMDILLTFLLTMLRIGAFVTAAPLFSARFMPLQVRLVVAVCLATPLLGTVPLPDPEVLESARLAVLVLREIALGLSAGLLLQILFAVAVVAGDRIANTAGLGLAAQIDPSTGTQSPVIGQFFSLFLIAIFLSVDGHLAAIRLVSESYTLIPIAAPIEGQALVAIGTEAASTMFFGAAQIMMPVVGILLILNAIIGVITRSAPQLNIFAFGFPLTMSATLLLLFLTTTGTGFAFAALVEDAIARLALLFEAARGG
ncbi:MAG: flagellar biosynthetic protein FliR [Pseudomonadota bacterium]